jgi:hypothetical protein
MEVEYISCCSAVSNAVWIKRFIESLNLCLNSKPINMFCDSKSVISLIKSGAQSSKDKHIDVNYHYIQDIAEIGEIEVEFISSLEKVANPITKGLFGKVQRTCSYNGIKKHLGGSYINVKAQTEGFGDA